MWAFLDTPQCLMNGRVLCTASTAFWMPFLIHNVPRKVSEWRCFWALQQNNRRSGHAVRTPEHGPQNTERMIQGNYQLLISARRVCSVCTACVPNSTYPFAEETSVSLWRTKEHRKLRL